MRLPAPRAALLLVVLALAAVTGPAAAQTGGCIADPAGDADDRVDLTTACVEVGADAISVTAEVRTPSDPAADAAWDRTETAVTWGLDGDGDGTVDAVVVFGVEAGGVLRGSVVDPGTQTETCIELDASPAGGTYAVLDIPRSCLPAGVGGAVGGAGEVALDATASYDTGSTVLRDRAPDTGLGTVVPEPDAGRLLDRVAGPTRIETAVAIAARSFPDGAPTAYLARADEVADAVAAGTLTAGPTLLVPGCGALPPVVAAELDRLGADEVVALGGPEAVCDAVLAEAAEGRSSRRLAGADRVATAAAIADEAFPATAAAAYLVAADAPTDAVAGGSLVDGPLLLVPRCGDIPPPVADVLDRLSPGEVVALGGEAAICDATLQAAAEGVDATTGRLAGADRIATAAAVAPRAFPGGADTTYLARADVLADAVASGSLVDGPVVLVPSCGAPPPLVVDAVDALSPRSVVALGGEAAICPEMLEAFRR